MTSLVTSSRKVSDVIEEGLVTSLVASSREVSDVMVEG